MIFGRDKKKSSNTVNTQDEQTYTSSLEDSAISRWKNISAQSKNGTNQNVDFTPEEDLQKRNSYLTSLMRDDQNKSQEFNEEHIELVEDDIYDREELSDFEEYENSIKILEDDDLSLGASFSRSNFIEEEDTYKTPANSNNLSEREDFEHAQRIAIKLTQEFDEKDLFKKHQREEQIVTKNTEETTPPPPANKPKTLSADFSLSIEDDLTNRFGSNLKSALGEGTMIDGTFSFETPVKVDGSLSGEIKSQSALIVGKNAKIHANIKVGSLIVLGEVEGDIVVEDLVEIRSSGSIQGNITTKRLALEEGGMLQGLCTMID